MQMEMSIEIETRGEPRVVTGTNWRSYLAVLRMVNRGFDTRDRNQTFSVTKTDQGDLR